MHLVGGSSGIIISLPTPVLGVRAGGSDPCWTLCFLMLSHPGGLQCCMLLVCLPLKLLRLTCWPRTACANTLATGRCCRRWTDCQRLCRCRRCHGCDVRLWAGRAQRCWRRAVHVASTMSRASTRRDDTLDAPRCLLVVRAVLLRTDPNLGWDQLCSVAPPLEKRSPV